MSERGTNLPPEQEGIRAKCFHPTGTFVGFPKEEIEQSIPERFEKIVRAYPERLAVKSKTGSLTYDGLNRASNRLARAILARTGLRPGPVGLFLEDGVQLITAHLATLKAGKFSFGLDPAGSGTRTTHLLDDSQTSLIVADRKTELVARQRANRVTDRINMDELDSGLGEENLGLSISPEAYCYVRYTSGSTGQAKGGLKTHRHVLHAVMNATNNFHICADDRSMLLTRASSLGKYAFEALLNGAALGLFYAQEEGLVELADWLIQEQITMYYSFPTAFRHFVNALSYSNNFPKLRLIRLEGEPVYRSDVELYRRHFSSGCLLVNSFSSTETGPICLYFLDKDTEVTGTCMPVGYPVDGMRVLLIDEFGETVACNQTGEIAVKSPFLSSGYWQRHELTQAKFQSPDDHGKERVYLTGDLGRWSEDGCLELIGRKDLQVKIRSFRVDVGEVEAVLKLHPDVREIAIIASKDRSDNTRLTAYVVPHSYPPPTINGLREFLKQRVPDYMIPAAFVILEKLPVMSTGKVDRRALPDPGTSRPKLDTPYVVSRTQDEEELARIWAEVLSVNQVGIYDNFFDLGGHSLAATRVVSQVIKKFQLEVPLQSLFQSPTIAEMAAVILKHRGQRLGEKELERMLGELEALSDEEVQRRLSEETTSTAKGERNE
jgi:amino acid adenylation domain-containing protein